MEAKKLGNKYILRIDKNEEVIETLTKFCTKEKIKLATANAIGAASKIKVGLFDIAKKTYLSQEFEGVFEITSLMGTISMMNDQTYLHLHINFSDQACHAYGGHLNYCLIGATCEMVIDVIEGQITRKFEEEIGLNLFDFPNENN